jgi:hypothetical protein
MPGVPTPTPPSLPEAVSAGFSVHGEGVVALGGGGLHLRGAVDGRADAGGFALAVRDGSAVYQQPDGSWVALPGPAGPLGAVLVEPGAVARVLRSPEGEVRHEGTAEVEGRRVERYRFRVRADALRAAEPMEAEAWIDGDGRVHRLDLRTDGAVDPAGGARWRTRVGLRLADHGRVAVPTDLPAVVGAVPAPEGPSRLVYPFGAAVRATAGAG